MLFQSLASAKTPPSVTAANRSCVTFASLGEPNWDTVFPALLHMP